MTGLQMLEERNDTDDACHVSAVLSSDVGLLQLFELTIA